MIIGMASKNESGSYAGGSAGDQTGQEVYKRSWYNRPWNVIIRPDDSQMAEDIASFVETACDNNNIGYSQNDRNSLLNECLKTGYNAAEVGRCNCDCSSLVSCALISAGCDGSLFYNGNCCTTSTLRSACVKNGGFTFLGGEYLTNQNMLRRGDILLYEGHHVAVALENGCDSGSTGASESVANNTMSLKALQEATKADKFYDFCIYGCDGKWGTECNNCFSKMIIKRGSALHNIVRLFQSFLGVDADGIFGPKTETAVKAFQSSNGLEVDGIIGINTIKKAVGV